MKIAVYGICKNEELNVNKWLTAANEADAIFVLDTGSEDKTRELLEAHPKVELHTANFIPFRFDIARNMIANQILDSDYDLAVFCDFDEELEPGWRQKLEEIPAPYDAVMFNMIFSRTIDGKPDVVYNRLMAHRPQAYVWIYPIHEVLTPVNTLRDIRAISNITVEHKPDTTKPRGQYLEMLQSAVEEFNHDPRMRQYLGREHLYLEEFGPALIHLEKHVTMQDDPICISESYRYIAQCHEAMGSPHEAEKALMRSLSSAPHQREPHAALSHFYQRTGAIGNCLAFALSCNSVPDSPNFVIRERRYYNEWPHHMAAWAYSQLGAHELAVRHITLALNLAPEHPQVIADFISLTGALPDSLVNKINSGELSVISYEEENEVAVGGDQPQAVPSAEKL